MLLVYQGLLATRMDHSRNNSVLTPSSLSPLRRHQPGDQRRAVLEEHADETQEVPKQFANASQSVPEVPEKGDDGIHAPLIADEPSYGRLP